MINNNSTTTPLLAGTSFTGTANTTSDLITISTNIVSDTIAAVSIQQSSNRIAWDVVKYFSYTTTGVSLVCTQDISLPFYRVIVQNISGTDMTYLRVYTILQTAEKEVTIKSGGNIIDISGNVVSTQGTSPWVDNVSQFGGSTVKTGVGVGGAGIPRVTVSSDSTLTSVGSITNAVTVQQSTPANLTATVTQGTSPWVNNITQIGGNAVATSTGASTSGTQRVVTSTDSTLASVGSITSAVTVQQSTAANLLATVTQGTSPWVNNITQIGGNAVVTGTGNSGLGIPRVTVSSDTTITSIGSIGNSVSVIQGTAANLLATVTQGTSPWVNNITQIGGNAVATSTGASTTGTQRVAVASDSTLTSVGSITNAVTVQQSTPANLTATVTPITITKGTQGTTGFTVQALKDAGRNVTNYFSAVPIITTNTDTLMSLTGYKGGVAVSATTTPAVVTAAKTLNISQIVCTYVSVTTNGFANFTLRANLAGTVVIGSPAVYTWQVGHHSTIVTTGIAGVSNTITICFPDGLQFAAGTGIGVSVQGYSATVAAAAVGYASVAISGYEY